VVVVLLLTTALSSSSGKSTLLKQCRVLHAENFSKQELNAFAEVLLLLRLWLRIASH